MLDGILTSNAEGTRYVYAIVNKHPSDAQTLRLASNGLKKKSGKIKGIVLKGASTDDYNDIGAENRVVPEETSYKVQNGEVTLPPHSLNILILE